MATKKPKTADSKKPRISSRPSSTRSSKKKPKATATSPSLQAKTPSARTGPKKITPKKVVSPKTPRKQQSIPAKRARPKRESSKHSEPLMQVKARSQTIRTVSSKKPASPSTGRKSITGNLPKTSKRQQKTSPRDSHTTPASTLRSVKDVPASSTYAVVVQENKDKYALFEEALKKSGFWFALEEARFRAAVEKDHFSIVIKPDFQAYELTGSTATDPQLVEYLIDQLHERGYTQVIVAESRNSFDLWLENRDVQILADMLGYHYVTPGGRPYDIIDLAEDLVPGPFTSSSLLYGTHLPRIWCEAAFRIIFAKNQTDDEQAYRLCLDNLLSLLPLRDKDYHYKHRFKEQDVLLELLKHTTVDFCLIDGYLSNHGNAGTRVARPIETHCIIAGQHLLLTDYAAARKMGLDPQTSPNHAIALTSIGLPEPYRLDGDLTPYAHWINVHPLMLESVRSRQQWPELSQILQPILQMTDHESFPFKDPVIAQLNRVASSYLSGIDDNPTVFWSMLTLNNFLGLVYQELKALQIMHWKDQLWHQDAPLNIQQDAYTIRAYEAIVEYLDPLEKRARSLCRDENGLRWAFHEDGSVLFEFSRMIPVDYDDFVSRVDITRSIQFMNDYIGGRAIPIQQDGQARVTHQVERNIYLPQPNYLVFYQGQNIDVSKLEYIRYQEHEQKMFWKTVKSENGSASYDDGTVRFSRQDNGETLVSVFGRQQFTLPLFWQVVNLDNFPALKHVLFAHAYTTFFSNTMSNFEAVYEGRDVRIGKAWDSRAGESDVEHAAYSLSNQIGKLLTSFQDIVQGTNASKGSFIANLFTTYQPQPEYIDADGFHHFKHDSKTRKDSEGRDQPRKSDLQTLLSENQTSLLKFWKDLSQTIQKDAGVHFA
ncbi:MAG: DUF362 domain-containing protein [Nitrospirota bacterium]|nr:DUF362 domain-containing protein [Nitrospirota bacterium]